MAFGWDDALILGTLGAVGAASSAGISSAVGSATSSRVARKMAKYNIRNAKEQMSYQDQLQRLFSKDMTKWGLLTNPSFKMQGLRAAGLNPILAYDTSNANLASASYSAGSGVSGGYTPASTSGIDIASAYDSVTRGDKAKEEKDLVRPTGEANIENIKTQSDLNATKVSTEEMNQDVLEAKKKQIEEETARTKLDNDLKSATNARDIFRAKTDYEVESTRREIAEKRDLYHGFAPPHDTPYGHKREMELGKNIYLDNPTRQKILDFLGGVFGTAKAVSGFVRKR